MKVFLTGGTGFIGQALTRQLLQRQWEVIALVRRPQSPQALVLQAMGAQLVEGDVTDIDSMRSAMQGADLVIHNAGVYEYGISRKNRDQATAVNINGTENVLKLAQELGIARTIYVSSTWAYGVTGDGLKDETFQRNTPFRTFYEATKTHAHETALRYQQDGLPLVIVCPHGVVGPNDHSVAGYGVRFHLNHIMLPFAWAGDVVFTFVHVDDLAEGIALAAERGRPGETYIFTGEPMPMREMYALWAEYPGGFRVRFYMPARVAAVMFAPMEPLQRLLGLPAVLSRETVWACSENFAFSNQKARDELGWTHRSARQMWHDTIEGEIALRNQRQTRNPIALLKPV